MAAAAGASETSAGEFGYGFEAGQRAFLEFEVNGVRRGEALVYVRGADIWVDAQALKDAGIEDRGRGERIMIDGRWVVRMGSLEPQVVAVMDEDALLLRVMVDTALLGRTVIELGRNRPTGIQYRRDNSAFVNYGANLYSGDNHLLSLETGVTVGPALLSGYVSHSARGVIRGPISATIDRPRQMHRWVVGDTVVSNGTLGGSAQLAGVSFSSNYGLDPYFVRFPSMGLSGALSAPSTVDVYVNNRLVRREQLQPGAFDIHSLPLPVGANSATIVMRDAFGREQEVSGSFYLSGGVLAPGLQQFQYAVGAARELSATENWQYGDPLLFGMHRRGMTELLTLGGQVEASPDLVTGGPHAVTRLGRWGELEVGAAASRHTLLGLGYAWSAGYLYTNRALTLGGSLRGADRAFVTTATGLGSLDGLSSERGVNAGSRIGRRANLSVSYYGRRYHARPDQNLLSLTTTVQMPRQTSLFVTASRTQSGRDVSPAVFAGMNLRIGPRDSVGASTEYRDDRARTAFETVRSMPVKEGYGYRVRAETGDSAAVDADGIAQSRWGRYEVRHNAVADRSATSVSASGALVLIGGRVFATRPVRESFGLIRVPDVPHVRAYLSNQEIGRTDRHGNLLVPDLLPYYGNRLRIADEDVPMDRSVSARELLLAPPSRGGAIAEFPVKREVRVAGRIVIQRGLGTIVPAFGRIAASGHSGGAAESFIGPDGEFYLEGLDIGENEVDVEYSDMDCTFTLVVTDSDQPVRQAGTAVCLLP